jgi:hypothetical protein
LTRIESRVFSWIITSIRFDSFINIIYRIWCSWHYFTKLGYWWWFLSWVWSMVAAEKIGYLNWFSAHSEGVWEIMKSIFQDLKKGH